MQVSSALHKANLNNCEYARQLLKKLEPLQKRELVSIIKLG
jgi:hypothetical protein